jgi:hypothetical protein
MSQSATVEGICSFPQNEKIKLFEMLHTKAIMSNGNGHGENIKSKLLYNSRQNTTI